MHARVTPAKKFPGLIVGFVAAFGQQGGLEAEADERLAPGATAEDVRSAAGGRGETVVVVGHQPDCSKIAAELTGGEEPPFAPAEMLAIQLA